MLDQLAIAVILRSLEDYNKACINRDHVDYRKRIQALYDMADIEQFMQSTYCGSLVDVSADKLSGKLDEIRKNPKKTKNKSVFMLEEVAYGCF